MASIINNELECLPYFNLDDDNFTRKNAIQNQVTIHNIDSYNANDNVLQLFDNNENDHALSLNQDLNFNYDNYLYRELGSNAMCCSKYYDADTFLKVKGDFKQECLSLLHYNIRSSYSHHDEFFLNINTLDHKFSFIGISETWLKPSNCSLYGHEGYIAEFKCKEVKKGGGVALYINKDLHYNRRYDLENIFNVSTTEVIFVEIPKNVFSAKPFVIAEIYRPPGTSIPDFNDCMDQCLTCINEENKLFYLLGDFNINLFNIQNHVPTATFINTMFSHLGVPLINRPTRITQTSATLIDHIYTNAVQLLENDYHSGILCMNISDHLPVFHLCNTQSNVSSRTQVKPRHLINNKTLGKLKSNLRNQDWSIVKKLENTDKAFTVFNDIFMKCFNECIPIVEKCHNNNHKPWVTAALLNSIKRKNKLYVQYCKNRCYVTEMRYKLYKNKLTQVMRKAEKDYIADYISQYKTEAKKMWSLINDKLGRNSHNSTLPEMCEGEEKALANKFNDFFTNVGPKLAESITNKGDPLAHLGKAYEQSMYTKPVTEKELLHLISELKNSSAGIDSIKASVIKAVKDELMSPMLYLLNQSLRDGIFPDALKVAIVTPIYKKGCKNTY